MQRVPSGTLFFVLLFISIHLFYKFDYKFKTMGLKITAKDKQEFESIFQKVNLLPSVITNQINTVEKTLLGYECTILKAIGRIRKIYIPYNARIINEENSYVIIFTYDDFTFRIQKDTNDQLFEYTIVQEPIK